MNPDTFIAPSLSSEFRGDLVGVPVRLFFENWTGTVWVRAM